MTLGLGAWMSDVGGVCGEGIRASGWSVDTRTLVPGDLYFALRGPSHDGHDYVEQAIQKGAAGVVVDHAIEGVRKALVVQDTLAELRRLAGWARKRWGGQVIGVTGSAGKTTTKDAIAHLLSADMKVGKTIGNLNNHVGVPLSILRLPEDCRVAILEMGMNHAGEIRALAEIARPNVGVVTNVGYAHTEYFDNIEGVALAKRELIEALPADGPAVLGEMLELGPSAEPLHREIGSYVAGRGIDVLIGIRGASRHMVDEAVRAGMSGAAYFFEDPGTAGDFVRGLAREGDAILFKGSRGVAVEKAMERLLAGREA